MSQNKGETQTASYGILENFVFRFKLCSKMNNPRSQHSFSTPVVKGLNLNKVTKETFKIKLIMRVSLWF